MREVSAEENPLPGHSTSPTNILVQGFSDSFVGSACARAVPTNAAMKGVDR